MRRPTVLISGAGIAGSTLAFWLARNNIDVTVVERSGGLRSSGSPVDVRGAAVRVAERMGVMPKLRAAATRVTNLSFVNTRGAQVARIDMRAMQKATRSREVEIPRGDLASVLFEAVRSDVEVLFDDSISALEQDADGVDVTFEGGAPRRFDLVVGADGLHSRVRRVAFGPDADFVHHLGIYVATLPIDSPLESDETVLMFNTPGKAISLHPSNGHPLAAFLFRSPEIAAFDYRDAAQHKRILAEAYAGASWRTSELMECVAAADDLYFDSLSQVRLSRWSRGRVALLGDAASCASLLGEGSSLAIAGADTLAAALAESPDDPAVAFARYEERHRMLVDPIQRTVSQGANLMVPATRRGILVRNAVTRLWPLAVGAARVRTRLGGVPVAGSVG